MTCIVGIEHDGKVYMGADSQMTQGNTKYITRHPKVFKKGNMLFGCCNWLRTSQLLMYSFEIPKRETVVQTGSPVVPDMSYLVNQFIPSLRQCFKEAGFMTYKDGEDEGEDFMLGYKGVIYEVERNFQIVSSVDGSMAMGSGWQYALGSLYTTLENPDPVARINTALYAAQRYDTCVCEPFTILSL